MLNVSIPTGVLDIKFEYHINDDYDDETSDEPLTYLCHELEKMVGQNVVETIELLIGVQSGCYDCAHCHR